MSHSKTWLSVLVAVFIVLGLACWQLLAPGERPPGQYATPGAT